MKTLVLSTCLAFVNCCLFYCGRSMSQQLVLRLSYILLLRRKEVFNKSFFLLPFIVGLSLSKEHFLRLELNSGSCHQKRYNKIHLCHTLSKLNSFAYTRQERGNVFFVTCLYRLLVSVFQRFIMVVTFFVSVRTSSLPRIRIPTIQTI